MSVNSRSSSASFDNSPDLWASNNDSLAFFRVPSSVAHLVSMWSAMSPIVAAICASSPERMAPSNPLSARSLMVQSCAALRSISVQAESISLAISRCAILMSCFSRDPSSDSQLEEIVRCRRSRILVTHARISSAASAAMRSKSLTFTACFKLDKTFCLSSFKRAAFSDMSFRALSNSLSIRPSSPLRCASMISRAIFRRSTFRFRRRRTSSTPSDVTLSDPETISRSNLAASCSHCASHLSPRCTCAAH
mmetsp:Transcript_135001/g.305586  ORF Transcript_135001/g.305586 Transcript_135001/m.305586 type:complete len:250 (+) Transcript_135001:637-1386(+)